MRIKELGIIASGVLFYMVAGVVIWAFSLLFDPLYRLLVVLPLISLLGLTTGYLSDVVAAACAACNKR